MAHRRSPLSTLTAKSAILRVHPALDARKSMAVSKKQTAKKKSASKKSAAKKATAKKATAKKTTAKKAASKNSAVRGTTSEKGIFCRHGNIAGSCLRCK
jgi:hypothetical protein